MDGDSLEAALRDYGPAAIEDLLPRLRVIAATLDQAHAAGQVHGSLHPQNIFVSAATTRVSGLGRPDAAPIQPPYSAPEIAAGGPAQPASDQFALAAIAFEWMSGRRIVGPAARPVEVRTLPGVDRDAMSKVFTRALAPEPGERFLSCTAFSNALAATVIPVLPLGGANDRDDVGLGAAVSYGSDRPLENPIGAADEPLFREQPEYVAEVPALVADEPASNAEAWAQPAVESKRSPREEPVTSWQPSSAYPPAGPGERFSGGMLVIACLVGMVVGFAAGYMARPRALQSGILAGASGRSGAPGAAGAAGVTTPGTEAAVSPAAPATTATQVQEAPVAPRAVPAQPGQAATPRASESAPAVAASVGRLLIRSSPSGASVQVDGVARGVTPLALRDLELGSRAIVVAQRGYISEEQRIVLTAARPSRSVEVRLTLAAASAPPGSQPAPPPPAPRTAASATATGSLLIESRPPGAAVVIDGQPRGTTPITIDALPPGDYSVNLSLAGYQPFATTVRVVAGRRTRAAASLSVQE